MNYVIIFVMTKFLCQFIIFLNSGKAPKSPFKDWPLG